MIYFSENMKGNEIKIGHSSNLSNRMKQHETYGFSMICALPGSEEIEKQLHKAFRKHLCRGNEYYHRDDEILEYCLWLIDKGFALPDISRAVELPELPFSAWSPDKIDTKAVEADGQYTIFNKLPITERIRIVSAQAQNHSLTDEWYTPEDLIDLAKSVLGKIDTDPATSYAVNQKYINAKIFYTKASNGLDLSRPWHGNVWLNPPYGKGEGSARDFVARLCLEFKNRKIEQAISCINLASMSAKWFNSTIPEIVSAHCIVDGRPNFMPPQGVSATSSPNKGIVLSYFGTNQKCFCHVFESIGQILVPYKKFGAV